ncbi:MAG: M50 family metallopeptidase [Oscillospiraceae bacterium]|nr:M50 family metallopeptidase [Oscillospiraceae bacterium]
MGLGAVEEEASTQIKQVFLEGPAEVAGIEAGDIIISINNVIVNDDVEQTVYIIANSPYEEVVVEVRRDGEYLVYTVVSEIITRYVLGLEFSQIESSFLGNVRYGFWETVSFTSEIIEGMVQLFTGRVQPENLMGPVGISHVVTRTQGFAEFISMMALISLAVGVTNLLPFPPLDGGKIVIYLVEIVRRKPIKEETELRIQMARIYASYWVSYLCYV